MEGAFFLAALFAKLDSGELEADKINVEKEEGSNDETKHASQDVRSHDKVGDFVIEGVRMAHSS